MTPEDFNLLANQDRQDYIIRMGEYLEKLLLPDRKIDLKTEQVRVCRILYGLRKFAAYQKNLSLNLQTVIYLLATNQQGEPVE